MGKQSTDLREAMHSSALGSTKASDPQAESTQAGADPGKGREGTVAITAHLPPGVRQQLKAIALEQGTTVQNLVAEALNDLFAKHGKPEIAPVEAS